MTEEGLQRNPERALSRVKRLGYLWEGRRPPYPPWMKESKTWKWLRSKLKTLRTHRGKNDARMQATPERTDS